MLEMRTVTADEFVEWVRVEARAYGNRLNNDPEILRPHFDLDRSIAVFDKGNIVGGAHSHRLEMSVPGASAVTAGGEQCRAAYPSAAGCDDQDDESSDQ